MTRNLAISCCCFAEDGKELYQELCAQPLFRSLILLFSDVPVAVARLRGFVNYPMRHLKHGQKHAARAWQKPLHISGYWFIPVLYRWQFFTSTQCTPCDMEKWEIHFLPSSCCRNSTLLLHMILHFIVLGLWCFHWLFSRSHNATRFGGFFT